jgi:SAM-dependent methyltransferase
MTGCGASARSSGEPSHCIVCRSSETRLFLDIEGRRYWRCELCLATFLDSSDRPDRESELAHYRHHENDPNDPRYRRFVSRLATPLMERLAKASLILDYGCGPGSALAAILREAGHSVRLFDPFFVPDASAFDVRYDAIACSEVAEHFHAPAVEFDRLGALLKPGGWLGVMTCFQTDDERFAKWHYRLDPTHVVFYREATLRAIANVRGWQFECVQKDVALMRTSDPCALP